MTVFERANRNSQIRNDIEVSQSGITVKPAVYISRNHVSFGSIDLFYGRFSRLFYLALKPGTEDTIKNGVISAVIALRNGPDAFSIHLS